MPVMKMLCFFPATGRWWTFCKKRWHKTSIDARSHPDPSQWGKRVVALNRSFKPFTSIETNIFAQVQHRKNTSSFLMRRSALGPRRKYPDFFVKDEIFQSSKNRSRNF